MLPLIPLIIRKEDGNLYYKENLDPLNLEWFKYHGKHNGLFIRINDLMIMHQKGEGSIQYCKALCAFALNIDSALELQSTENDKLILREMIQKIEKYVSDCLFLPDAIDYATLWYRCLEMLSRNRYFSDTELYEKYQQDAIAVQFAAFPLQYKMRCSYCHRNFSRYCNSCQNLRCVFCYYTHEEDSHYFCSDCVIIRNYT